jgi:hypothetical protein
MTSDRRNSFHLCQSCLQAMVLESRLKGSRRKFVGGTGHLLHRIDAHNKARPRALAA